VVVKSDTTSATTCGCIHWTYIFYSLEQAPGTEAHFSSEAALSTWWYPQQPPTDESAMRRRKIIRVCGYHRAPQDWRGLVRLNDGADQLAPFKFLTSACAHLLDDDQVSSHMVKQTQSSQTCGASSLCNIDADANPALCEQRSRIT
jgi:hypothetical protein